MLKHNLPIYVIIISEACIISSSDLSAPAGFTSLRSSIRSSYVTCAVSGENFLVDSVITSSSSSSSTIFRAIFLSRKTVVVVIVRLWKGPKVALLRDEEANMGEQSYTVAEIGVFCPTRDYPASPILMDIEESGTIFAMSSVLITELSILETRNIVNLHR